jgi:hypothetical protein
VDRANAWESRFGWRVDLMAAVAYLGGPVTGKWSNWSGNGRSHGKKEARERVIRKAYANMSS